MQCSKKSLQFIFAFAYTDHLTLIIFEKIDETPTSHIDFKKRVFYALGAYCVWNFSND